MIGYQRSRCDLATFDEPNKSIAIVHTVHFPQMTKCLYIMEKNWVLSLDKLGSLTCFSFLGGDRPSLVDVPLFCLTNRSHIARSETFPDN